MLYPSSALDGVDALWQNPRHWFARQFAFYGIVAAVVVPAVLGGGCGLFIFFKAGASRTRNRAVA